MLNRKNAVKRAVALVGLSVASVSAFAAGGPAAPDLSSLTPDFTTVSTAMLAVAGAVVGIYVTWKGIKLVIRAIKGA